MVTSRKWNQISIPTSLGVLTVILDQSLKLWVEKSIPLNQTASLGDQKYIHLISHANPGILWQKFSSLIPGEVEPFIRYYPTLILLLFSILFLAFRLKESKLWEQVGFALFLSGGVSNLISHWRSYFVTDTFQVYLGRGIYQPFNLADTWILFGGSLLIVLMMREFIQSFSSPTH